MEMAPFPIFISTHRSSQPQTLQILFDFSNHKETIRTLKINVGGQNPSTVIKVGLQQSQRSSN